MAEKSLLKKIGAPLLLVGVILTLSGCGASYSKVGTNLSGEKVEITKKDVHAKTKMSETIFLEPVAPAEQIIYFRFRNTSDEDLDVSARLKSRFEKLGFRVTRNPKEANFLVQANLLKVGEMDEAEQKNYLGMGYAGTTGAVALGTVSMLGGGSSRGSLAAAGAGLLLGMAVEAARIKDVHYALVTDVEIRQRPLEGEQVSKTENVSGQMGASGAMKQSSTLENVKWKVYRTRIVSSAYGPGLDFSQAKPFLEDGMVRALAGTM
jgi:hypothetical protein